ncbi:MAG: ketol-acid reductoisomerase [Acidimicrobiia bacterium]|nr:ketol-acid reductoisomerase [Acidimicrobiia bacterium]
MESNVFDLMDVDLGGTTERVLAGGRHLFPLLTRAFGGIERIGVIGWGPQGRAQALNLRDSLADAPIDIAVGLRAGSPSLDQARAEGFSEEDGTLGEMFEVIGSSDLVILLIADAALADLHEEIFRALKPGAIVGLSHGFLLAHLQSQQRDFPPNTSVVAVCPKGMGASVRRLYEQGRAFDGAGINCSVAVHADVDGRAGDVALGWAVAIGAPFIFETTLESEYLSDIAGERAILLSIPHAIAEAVYRRCVELGDTPTRAFLRSTESMTGPLARTISAGGLRAVVEGFNSDERRAFEDSYCATYHAFVPLIAELYDEVHSGNEIASVRLAAGRLERYPMPTVDGSRMWGVGRAVREQRDERGVGIDPLTAGIFCGAMMAQVDTFESRGHPWSEIANESVIELVDSLIPYMHARGVAYMIDNCSTTARLGARKWAPRFEAAITQQVFPTLDGPGSHDDALVKEFQAHPLHDALSSIGRYRPSVDIAVS